MRIFRENSLLQENLWDWGQLNAMYGVEATHTTVNGPE